MGSTAIASGDTESANKHYVKAYSVAGDLTQLNKSSLRFRVSFALAAFNHAATLPNLEYVRKMGVLVQAANALEMDPRKRIELLKEAGDEELMEHVEGAIEDLNLDKLIQQLRIEESEGLSLRLKDFIISTASFQSPRMHYNSACKISQACQLIWSGQILPGTEFEEFANEGWRRLKDAISVEIALFDAAKEDPDLEFLRRAREEEFLKIRPLQ